MRPPSSRRKAATAFDKADLRTLAIAWQSSLAASGKGGGNVGIEYWRISERVDTSSANAAATTAHYEYQYRYDKYGAWRGHWILAR